MSLAMTYIKDKNTSLIYCYTSISTSSTVSLERKRGWVLPRCIKFRDLISNKIIFHVVHLTTIFHWDTKVAHYWSYPESVMEWNCFVSVGCIFNISYPEEVFPRLYIPDVTNAEIKQDIHYLCYTTYEYFPIIEENTPLLVFFLQPTCCC